MTQVLQVRNIFARLNLEQVQHIMDGIVAQRRNIDVDSLPTFDSEMNNFIEQLEQQGIVVQIPADEEVIEDVTEKQQAQTIIAELYAMAMSSPTDMKQHLFNKVQELEHLLFG